MFLSEHISAVEDFVGRKGGREGGRGEGGGNTFNIIIIYIQGDSW